MDNSKLASLKSLLAASVSGKVVYALSSLVSLPLLTKLLGAESIGLVGFFTTLLMVMMVLEGGLTSNLIQQLASYKSRSVHAVQRYAMATKCLVYTYVSIFICIGVVVALAIVLLSGSIATHWLHFQSISSREVTKCIALMGMFIGFNFIAMVLQGVLVGRENQKILNAVFLPYAFMRTLGAWIVLEYFFKVATVSVYFALQLAVQVLYVAFLFYAVYKQRLILLSVRCFRSWYLRKGIVFSRGVLLISLSSMLVVQYDKIYLSGSVPLDVYASYTLACTLAGLPYIFSSAFSSVLFPRFSMDLAKNNNQRVAKIFSSSVSIVSLIMILFAVAIYCYSPAVIELIFARPIADEVNRVLPVIVVATSIQCLLVVPFALQLAAKWTSLSLRINLVSIPIIIVLLPLAVREWGVSGGAYIWLAYNIFSLGCTFYFVVDRFDYLKNVVLKNSQVFVAAVVSLGFVHYTVGALTAHISSIYLALVLQGASVILTFIAGLYCIKQDVMNFK